MRKMRVRSTKITRAGEGGEMELVGAVHTHTLKAFNRVEDGISHRVDDVVCDEATAESIRANALCEVQSDEVAAQAQFPASEQPTPAPGSGGFEL